MRRTLVLVGGLFASLVAAPFGMAQTNANVTASAPSESVGVAGVGATALIVLVVLAILVVALIVALASQDRYP